MKTPTHRVCTACGQEKELETEFRKQRNGKYGRQSACKECVKEQLKEYRKTPEGKRKHREYQRKHREKPGYKEKHESYRHTPSAAWKRYRYDAEKRGVQFSLSVDDFKNLFHNQPCFYCGCDFNKIGVDRIDNDLGYEQENVVSCCPTCNIMKRTMNKNTFIQKCVEIVKKHGIT